MRAPDERFTVLEPLGRPISLRLVAVVLPVVIVRPVLESLMFPELSTILVLDAPELPLTAEELRDVPDALLA